MRIKACSRVKHHLLPLLVLGVFIAGCSDEKTEKPDLRSEPEPQENQTAINLQAWPQVTPPLGVDTELEAGIDALLARMSLEEKVGQMMQAEIQSLQAGDVRKYHLGSVLNGGGSWPYRKENPTIQDWLSVADSVYDESMDDSDGKVAIPIIWGTDAVHGHNNVIGATIYPHNIGLGAARNPALVHEIGKATAMAVRATGIEWVFAPTVAVARNDGWGRTYESYSEDPAIVAEYAQAMVTGLQGNIAEGSFLQAGRVVATAKHFIGDGATWQGDDQGDARVSEHALISIHNAGYPAAIGVGVQTVMASFNSWYGKKMHGNKDLLTDVLKGRMGFDGFVVGDWNGHGQVRGCTNSSCAQAINAGVDLLMVPYDWRQMIPKTLAQVRSGEISEARIDDAVRRILRVKFRAGLFDSKPSQRAAAPEYLGHNDHKDIARQAVRESLVLLKNANQLLPIAANQRVMVAGAAANDIGQQCGGWTITWQGTGNTNAKFPAATSIYQGIADAMQQGGGSAFLSVDGSYSQAPDLAVVVFGETPYAEGQGDISSLEFEPGDKTSLNLLKKLKAEGIPVVSVFLSGRPLWVNPELNASDAFVAAFLPGSEGAGVADVLVADGSGNPRFDFKGLLSFSWPMSPLDTQLNSGEEPYAPLFPLGYGLNYASGESGIIDTLPEELPGVDTGEPTNIDFYVGRPMQPWNVFIHHKGSSQILSGAFSQLQDGSVGVQTSDKDLQEDALHLKWKAAEKAALSLTGGDALDLTGHLSEGTLAFDINVRELSEGGLGFHLACGEDCRRWVPWDKARELQGEGWQSVQLALNCFVQDGDDLSKVAEPFVLRMDGSGETEIANIRFLLAGEPNISCPDYKTVSLEPEPLNKYWAKLWWKPRHEQILERNKAGNVDMIMIGDSITHWFEQDGKAVWDEFYAKRNAVNMGFAGDRTENVLWRFENGALDGISPKLAVLLIGTNNTGHRMQAAEYTAAGIRKILDTLRSKLPETKILMLAIFPRSEKPDDPMRVLNEAVNARIAAFADGKSIHFININHHFLDEQGVLSKEIAPDLLHLNEQGYRIWAQAMEPSIEALLQ